MLALNTKSKGVGLLLPINLINSDLMTFKNSFVGLLALTKLFIITSCNDSETVPMVIDEDKNITTLRITLEPFGGSTPNVVLTLTNLNETETAEVSGPLVSNQSYSGRFEVLNENKNPIEDITEIIKNQEDKHQIFYGFTGNISSITYSPADVDRDGNPVGLRFELITGDAGTANLNATLVRNLTKPNTGIENAGGTVDFQANFDLVIE